MLFSRIGLSLLAATLAFGGSRIHLKTRLLETEENAPVSKHMKGRMSQAAVPGHMLVQFSAAPTPEQVRALEERGAQVVNYVPDDAFLVRVTGDVELDGLGLRWAGALDAADKISPALDMAKEPLVVVEFHSDVTRATAEWVLQSVGIRSVYHPDLPERQLLAYLDDDSLAMVTAKDEVAYVFPASPELLSGAPAVPCLSARTQFGMAAQYTALVGDGWDGPGQGEATIHYVLPGAANIPASLSVDMTRMELLRALTEWSRYARLTFLPTENGEAERTVRIMFAERDHGDGHAFDGPRGTLAHTFYPAPPNPEPLAGDMHLDADESWNIGFDIDVFSVALHEFGHALGLGHSDNPDSVMYPYYRRASALKPEDIDAIRQLYAAQNEPLYPEVPPVVPTQPEPVDPVTPTTPGPPTTPATPVVPATPPPAAPLALQVFGPTAAVEATSFRFTGTASGGTGAIIVSWNSGAASGIALGYTAWYASVPLVPGRNDVVFTATDAAGAQTVRTITATRIVPVQTTPVTPAPPPTPTPTPVPNPTPAPTPTTPTTPQQPAVKDVTAPAITIFSPASSVATVSAASVRVTGAATDNVGVGAVVWSTSAGAAGTATGTTQWETGAIPLLQGINTIVIRAFDTSGNVSWRAIRVTRR